MQVSTGIVNHTMPLRLGDKRGISAIGKTVLMDAFLLLTLAKRGIGAWMVFKSR